MNIHSHKEQAAYFAKLAAQARAMGLPEVIAQGHEANAHKHFVASLVEV